jgi:EAL domain-containing protein (putative c-di-GMP-specific phosphodiesterase class I)
MGHAECTTRSDNDMTSDSTSFRQPYDRLATDLVGAVGRGEIVAYYQPQLDIATERIVAVESLSRWNHPELGLQSPLDFIPIAEEIGLINEIGNFMMEDGCRCAVDLERRGTPVDVSVNVSAIQLGTPDFIDELEGVLSTTGFRPGAMTIEITESRLIANRPRVSDRLGALRELGVGISIDDFGVGHSSVEQLLALPATELKIDRTIVQDVASDALMGTIVGLVRDRGLRVVAEGVETTEQLDRVRALKCDRVQGYLIGMPMPRAELHEFLDARQ